MENKKLFGFIRNMKIQYKIGSGFLLCALLFLGNYGIIKYVQNSEDKNAEAIVNIAGRNRALCQKIVTGSELFLKGNKQLETIILNDIEMHEKTLTVLKIGGEISHSNRNLILPPASIEIMPAILDVEKLWKKIKINVETILNTTKLQHTNVELLPEDTNAEELTEYYNKEAETIQNKEIIKSLEFIENNNIQLFDYNDNLVTTYACFLEKQRNERVSRLNFYLILVLVFNLIISVGAIWLTLRLISKPLNNLVKIVDLAAEGNLSQNIFYDVNDEIGMVSKSVNKLIENQKRASTFAINIGDGKFNDEFTPLSEKDILGNSLITMRNNLQLANIKLNERNKELEQFAYITSHDLQEPLRSITSFVDKIRAEYTTQMDNKFNVYFNFITQSTSRMSKLIHSVLEYSRLGKNRQLNKVNCNELLSDIMTDISAIINESKATIEYKDLPIINALPVEMKQLFQNLILNALKFKKKDVTPEIKITAEKSDNFWLFAIQDNGIGINEKYQEKIFQIFQRLHDRSEYEGLGIGLAFCKKIVEFHNGKIWVESEIAQGSTFYFTIPNLEI